MAEPVEVAIVGMAAVFPGAPDLATYWSNILTGVDAITTVPPARWDLSYYDPGSYDPEAGVTQRSDRMYCRRGGFIEHASFDPARYGITPMAATSAEPDQLLALQVAADAFTDAGGEDRLEDRSRVGVIVGRGGYLTAGLARLDQRVRTAYQLVTTLRELLPDLDEARVDAVRAAFQSRLGPEQPESAMDLMPNLVAARIANRLDLAGPAYTIDAACASSLIAIDHAVAELATGRCDVVLVGGVHHCHDITLWSVFNQLGALSPTEQIRPFHRRADGILIGEGTGMVVLKRLADAADDRIYAVIRGVGVASEGRASERMSPHADGQVQAIERAWQAAGLDPTEPGALGLLEAHGSATPAGDATELASLTRVFGPPNGAGRDIGIGSVKSMIGHAMPAAGIAGLIKTALAVHHATLPPTLHCDDPHPALASTRFAPITEAAPWTTHGDTPRRAALNAFGFGGTNTHTILEQPPRTRRSRRTRVSGPERVLLLAGHTPAEVARQLQVPDTILLARDNASGPPAGGPCRLAIVSPGARQLALARRVVKQGTPWRGRDDVWFTTEPLNAAPATGRLAFLFPGLEQGFDPRVDDVADHFGLDRPKLDRAKLDRAKLGDTTDLGQHGLGVFTVGRLLDAALRELGLVPDLVAGHSVGEWNAMASAGVHPRRAVEDFITSFNPVTLHVPGVVFAALGCGAQQAAEAIRGRADVVVSHDNCPHQSMICGSEATVADVLSGLHASGITGQVLPFRSGFHTPMLAPYLPRILDTFCSLPVRPPVCPIWSATTLERYPDDPDRIRELATRHLLEPVRFAPLVRRLHELGVRAFVQVGSGSLPAFVADTLAGLPHLTVTANTARRSGLEQLRRVAAALWVEGWAPRFDRLPTAAAIRPASNGRTVNLDLGAPLVRLGNTVAALTPTAAVPARPPAGDPVLTEFDAVLRDATAAASDVFGSWTQHSPVSSPRQHSTTQSFSLATMPYLADHCFYRQAAGWPEPTDRYPVVPLTTILELMADAARTLSPGRTVVGIRDVQALRWLAVAPPVAITTTASLDADRNATVVFEGYARGTVLLADKVPPPPAAGPVSGIATSGTVSPSTVSHSRVSARELYADKWMFHGPAFQGVTELGPVTGGGIVGELTVSSAPGALLDNAGQLLGFWVMAQAGHNQLAFPAAIEQVRYYGPPPRPGERLTCVVRIVSFSDTDVVADVELRRADGRLWASIDRWRDRRFVTDEVTFPAYLFPEHNRIAQRQVGGWFLLRDPWSDPATRELFMRRYLSASERADYQRCTPRAARQWLLGRIAVKDAVRQWLWDAGAGPVFPAEITVTDDASGRLRVAGPFANAPEVSLAHTGPLAAALVGQHGDTISVGIDIELIPDRGDSTTSAILTDTERKLLGTLCRSDDTRPSWTARFRTAKQAVATAAGTGLGGGPHMFVVERVDGDRLLVAPPGGAPRRWVHTAVGTGPEPYAVAWTEGGEMDDA